MAWELLTKVYKLDPSRLYVTYFGGDEKAGLKPDTEARDLWLKMGLPESRLLPFGCKENFWEMGDQGPCGPCSEIHYDRIGGGRDCASLVNLDDPDVLEIWNLVFIQYNRESDSSLRTLPNKHVDTGMGLERLISVLQDKRSNYDTDAFMPLFNRIQELTGAREYTGKIGAADTDGVDMAYRVIADHARTLTFAISDGGSPSNDGRGYVLRRILRRGVRYARRRFGVQLGTFFPSLVDTVAENMGDAFPEIRRKLPDVKDILKEEELGFARTLDRGEKLFEQCLKKAKSSNAKMVDGRDAFKLYDTYGFPIDLTRLMAEENGMQVDEVAFEKEQRRAKELSRASKGGKTGQETVTLDIHALGDLEKKLKLGVTDDSFKYGRVDVQSKILGIYNKKEFVPSFSDDGSGMFGILMDRTNFYAEQGGQETDRGSITNEDGTMEFAVEDVKAYAGYVLHVGRLKYGEIKAGDQVVCSYDENRRWPLRNNHTATHVMNFALKKVLAEDIDQKGSLVAQDKLRFDFGFRSALKPEQLDQVEKIANEIVKSNFPVYSQEVSLDVGKNINGLRAVFGEVYPDPVRVVSVHFPVDELIKDPKNQKWSQAPIEFCGGTHVANTGDIGSFAILEESSIAKGIRRIVAVTGDEAALAARSAKEFQNRLDEMRSAPVTSLDASLRSAKGDLDILAISAVKKIQFKNDLTTLQRLYMDADKAAKAQALKEALERVNAVVEGNSDPFLVMKFDAADGKTISGVLAHLRSKSNKAALVVNVENSQRVSHACIVPKEMVEKGFKAVDWAGSISEILGGRMGGKDDSAQGSGDKVGQVDAAMEVANAFARLKLK